MVQFLSINFFLGILQFLLGFSKVPVFLCHSVPMHNRAYIYSTLRLLAYTPIMGVARHYVVLQGVYIYIYAPNNDEGAFQIEPYFLLT